MTQEEKKASARQCPTLRGKQGRDLIDRKGEEFIHWNKREQKGWTSREIGCTWSGPMDGMVIKKTKQS